MDLCVSHVNFWYPNSESISVHKAIEHSSSSHDWPKLDFIPAMQRRRLSSFAKMAMYVANQSVLHMEESLPIIFSSRHGDLHNTSDLLTDLSAEIQISPKAFSLSVHNAVPSLYSIISKNKSALNAIAAGKDTFFMSLVDAYARLVSGISDSILFIHADQSLPQTYAGFRDEIQLSHAVAMIVSLPESAKNCESSMLISLDMQHHLSDNNNHLPAALAYLEWFTSESKELKFESTQYCWSVNKNVVSN